MCWLSPPSARSHPADCKTEPGVFLSPSTPAFLYNPPTPAPYTVLLLFVENAWGKEGGWCVSVPATNEVVSSRGWQGWLRRVFTHLASSSGWKKYPGALWVRRPLPFVRARAEGGAVCVQGAGRAHGGGRLCDGADLRSAREREDCTHFAEWGVVCTSCSPPARAPHPTPVFFSWLWARNHFYTQWCVYSCSIPKKWALGKGCSFSEACTLFLLPIRGEVHAPFLTVKELLERNPYHASLQRVN